MVFLLLQNLPGPGYYCIDKNNACKSACAVEKRPFITSASRLAAFKAEGPSPTTYDATNVWKKRILKSFVPFGVQSERAFQTNCTETPGWLKIQYLYMVFLILSDFRTSFVQYQGFIARND